MRQAKFLGNCLIDIKDVNLPVPLINERLISVHSCALCGSELRQWHNGWPVTPGHEIFGRIINPGAYDHNQRVVVFIPIFCDNCINCKSNKPHLCVDKCLIGWQRDGGYADYLIAPVKNLFAVPDDIEDDLAPLLLDTIGTTAHGIRLAEKVIKYGRALVIGAGPIGLGSILVMLSKNINSIDVIDPQIYRTDFAKSLGAHVVLPDEALSKGYELIIEATGKDTARQLALEAILPEGAIIQIGESDQWLIKENRSIRLKDFYLIRSFYFNPNEYIHNMKILIENKKNFQRFIDDKKDLSEIENMFKSFYAGNNIKPLIKCAF